MSNSFATIVLLGNPLGTCDNCVQERVRFKSGKILGYQR